MSDKKFELLLSGLQQLIKSVSEINETEKEEIKPPKKRGRPPKLKVKDLTEEQDIEDEEDDEPVVRKGRGIKTGKGKVQARKIPLSIPQKRKNLFEKMPEFNFHKEDTLIDKKLNKGRKPTPRRQECTTKVKVKCRVCNHKVLIHPDEVSDPKRYTCNDCIVNRGGASGDYEEEILDDTEE